MTTIKPPPPELGRILKDLKQLEGAKLPEIKKGMTKLRRDMQKARFELPPLIPDGGLPGIFFGSKSACSRPLPRFGKECMPLLFKIYPDDFARVIDRVLPRLENETVARNFVKALHDFLSGKPVRE